MGHYISHNNSSSKLVQANEIHSEFGKAYCTAVPRIHKPAWLIAIFPGKIWELSSKTSFPKLWVLVLQGEDVETTYAIFGTYHVELILRSFRVLKNAVEFIDTFYCFVFGVFLFCFINWFLSYSLRIFYWKLLCCCALNGKQQKHVQ